MSRLFLCVHTSKLVNKTIIDGLVSDALITGWFFSVHGSFFFRSEHTAKELSKAVIARFGLVRFFIVEITDSPKWGALPQKHWEKILSKPPSKPAEELS